MTRNRILRAAIAIALLTSASALAQAPGQAPADGRGAGRGTRPPRVRTLSPGPDLGYGYDINPLSLPPDVAFARQVGGVAMNSQGHIFVFHRATAGKPQVLEFDRLSKREGFPPTANPDYRPSVPRSCCSFTMTQRWRVRRSASW
jgi:hypothetical protein